MSAMHCRLLLAVLWTAATCTRGLAEDRLIDFRGEPLPFDAKFFGPKAETFFKPGKDGLQVTLPKDREERGAVAIMLPVQLPGDFDIIARVKILQAEEPKTGHGVGVLLGIKHVIRLGRVVRADGEQLIFWDRNIAAGSGTPKMEGKAFPCDAQELRLRLKQRGATLHFWWAPGLEGDEYKEIHQLDYPDDVGLVKFIAQTGQQPCSLDVRLLDLRITTGEAVAKGAAAANQQEGVPTPASGRRLWWLAGAVAVLLLVAVGLALWGKRQARG